MEKSETRAIAESLGLRTARKPDSQEICFVRNGDFDAYVDEHLSDATVPGPILDNAGVVLGRHRGIGRYTVGQRKGLGISLGAPAFVTAIDPERNSLTVGSRDDLAVGGLVCDDTSFTGPRPRDGEQILIQHRAHGEVHAGRFRRPTADRFEVEYDSAVPAVAPGQSAALYSASSPDELLGGGVIAATLPVGADV
jgi:tRNA-specific 2-thiouridylase